MGISAKVAQNAQALNNLTTTQLAFRNRIINGNAVVAQRPSFAYPKGLAGYGGPDRFYAANMGNVGGQFTQSQGAITYNGVMKNAVVQTVNTAITTTTTTTNYWSGIQQRIEGYNVYDLLGQSATISFIFETNISGTYSFAVTDGTSANSWVSSFTAVANVPLHVYFTLPITVMLNIPNSTLLGLTVIVGAINTGTYQTATMGSWQAGDFFTASGATNWGMTIGNYISMTELQLEAGTVATSFENLPSTLELALCQRYYQVIGYNSNSAPDFFMGYVAAQNGCYFLWPLLVTMRTIPTGMIMGAWGYANVTGPIDVQNLSPDSINLGVTSAAAGAVSIWPTLTSGLTLSAEL